MAATLQAHTEQAETVVAELATQVARNSSPTPSPTTTATATATATETPAPVTLNLSANTNCRSGPAGAYEKQGAVLAGDTVLAYAKSTVENYWYIANPDGPGEFCWMWGEYAAVVGEAAALPVLTPLPSPIPIPPVTMAFHELFDCGSTFAVFKVHNTGNYTFMTADRYIEDLDNGDVLYGPEYDRHPFAPYPRACPPGHENEIYPDHVAYIYVPLKKVPSGHTARASLLVCTEDFIRGDCFANWIDFYIP